MKKQAQTLAGYIRQNLDEIEKKIEIGIRQEALVAELETHGYKTTLKGFRNFLYRARQRPIKKIEKNYQKKDRNLIEKNSSKKHENFSTDQLKKSKGFEFKKTSTIDESDLI